MSVEPVLNKAETLKNRVTVCSVAVYLLLFFVWCLVKPADTVSPGERRLLAERPSLRMQTVLDGRFAEQFEAYSQDQFPLREFFRGVKAAVSLHVMGRKDNHGVYRAEGHLSKMEYPLGQESIRNAGKHFEKIYSKYLQERDVEIYFSLIPDKNYFLAERNGYPAMDYAAFVGLAREEMYFADYIDIFPQLSLEDYYATDPHWRQEEIVDVAQTLLDGMTEYRLLDAPFEKKTLEQPFRGVYAGQFGGKTAGEELSYLDLALFRDCIVHDYETNRDISVYDTEKAAGKDPYELFLAGPKSLITVENPHADPGRQLIVFRDSFGSSMGPLLIPAYGKVTFADIRYISADYLGTLVDFDHSDVLFLYSTLVWNNSMTLK